MAQIADAHGRAELVHLGVATHIGDVFLVVDAEVLQVAEASAHLLAAAADRSALDGVEHLGRVKAEHRGVTEAGRTYAAAKHPEAVRRVINDRQPVSAGDFSDPVHIAEVAVYMHRQNRRCPLGNQRFQLLRVQGIGNRVDVAEHRGAAAAHDGMCRGREGERRRDDLAVQIKCLDHIFQGQMSVREQGQSVTSEVLLQVFFQFPVLHAHVCQPAAVPQAADLVAVFFKGRHGRACNIDAHGISLLFPFSRGIFPRHR